MHHVAGWWDGFELWVAGLPFIPQFVVVLVGAVPVSFLIAYLLDRGLRIVLRLLGRDRSVVAETDIVAGDAAAEMAAASEIASGAATIAPPEPALAGASMHTPGPRPKEAI
ncbi:hypothetical protein C5E45_30145 [Nocardia nova]|uniref:Uncharacterized protein n=1 Tax=Nocardia nova TaxID=37330 RepID=A0A2S6AHC2_9NOCA|nr:hypothetical protein [Nocardia nova]PPJ31546.1 hypothetical protein C5E41_06370 [Nocardia nova]PPJ34615.1 hypothetical protein C5E45_30145 [Nocardia nova]